MNNYTLEPIDDHIAMSLYQYNVRPGDRADKLFQHFSGECAEMTDLIDWVDNKNWATEMPLPTAKVYLIHAIERYGVEAAQRINDQAKA